MVNVLFFHNGEWITPETVFPECPYAGELRQIGSRFKDCRCMHPLGRDAYCGSHHMVGRSPSPCPFDPKKDGVITDV